MTVNPQETAQAAQPSDKELNFRKQEEMYNRKLDQERLARKQEQEARQQAEDRLAQLERMIQSRGRAEEEEDDSSDEPYVDHKRLQKAQARMEKKIVSETDNRIQQAVQTALAQERQNQWLKQNPDFVEVMDHAQEFADRDPELAETILAMPEGFERQKLVYKNIKALGLHKKEEAKASIQDKIEQNKRTPYYQPSGMASAPYSGAVGFDRAQASTPTVQKNAYDQMKALQRRLGALS